MEIGAWLDSLGLARYETAFRDNLIDIDILPELTDSDLAQLGIALGDRKRLLKAIAALSNDTALKPAEPPPPAPARAGSDAERRPITVMFCDLVGSTSLASKLDAEDWRELVNAYLDEASKAVAQFGGHVLKKLGDGLMALFGYPKAQENDAERAARAGLAILRALDDLNAKNIGRGLPALTARIGLETGPVVVDATGEVFGDAPNVAARVQSAAEPGTLFVTAAVQRQVAGLFVAEDKGSHELKGVPGRPTLYRLVRASGGGRRAGARSLTPLVGREEELATLARRWERARAGDGQFVQIVGEPGLGKSRLLEEFHIRLGETPHTWVEWASSQLLQNTPLHPIAEWGRQRFVSDAKFAELEAALSQVRLDPVEHAPLLAPLLDIPVPENRVPQLAADELRRKQHAAVIAWLLASARTQPIVLAFEDLQWADPTTLDLMKTLTERGGQAALLIVATSRPEFRTPWTMRSHHSVIGLAPLDRAQIGQMVSVIAERHALSKEAIEGVTNRTAGVPLFIEEVTRLLLDGGAQTIPPTLQQSLAARLDRLGEAREVAQIGAVLGREFPYALLQAVADRPDVSLDGALEKLVEADLLFVEGIAPSSNYRFKHALIQDAAYDSLLKNRRQSLHRSAGQALIAGSEPHPELVAHHFTQAGDTKAAIEWWGKAGDAALHRSAFEEAISHLGKAIEMMDAGGASGQRRGGAEDTRLRVGYARAVMITEGYTAEAAQAANRRIGGDDNQPRQATARWSEHYGQWTNVIFKGDTRAALSMAEMQLREAEDMQHPPMLADTLRRLGISLVFCGRFSEARTQVERARRLYDDAWAAEARNVIAMDFLAALDVCLAATAWYAGDVDAAKTHFQTAAASAQSTDAYTLVYVCGVTLPCLIFARNFERALDVAERAAAVSAERGIGAWEPVIRLFRSAAVGRQLDPAVGKAGVREALADLTARGILAYNANAYCYLADLEVASGATEDALTTIEQGLQLANDTGNQGFLAPLYAIRGDALAACDPASAEGAYREAISIAREQGGRTFALQAALPLARVLQSTNRPSDAYEVLSLALDGFAPSPELPAIAEAQALLASLMDGDVVKEELAKRQSRMKLHSDYAKALMWAKGFSSPDVQAAYGRLERATRDVNSPAERHVAFQGTWVRHWMRGEYAQALDTATAFLAKCEQDGDSLGWIMAARRIGTTRLHQGSLADGASWLTKALHRSEAKEAAQPAETHSYIDDGNTARVFLAMAKWCQGEIEASRRLMDAAIASSREKGFPPSIAVACYGDGVMRSWQGDAAVALPLAETVEALGRDHGMALYLELGQLLKSWATAVLSGSAQATGQLREGLEAHCAAGNRMGVASWKTSIAELEASAGRTEAALASLTEGLRLIEDTGERWLLARLLKVRGDVLAATDYVTAVSAYGEAVAVARDQGAKTFELLAALPLARLLQYTGRPLEAHDALAHALEGFAPTPELPAIAEAMALLAELGR
jgi:class 3 adenylate cyclase/tetratricopeptide (TPR) repeat protein